MKPCAGIRAATSGKWQTLSLRNKLLSFYAAMIFCILAINLFTSLAAFRYIRVFEHNLRSYFQIQSLRKSIELTRSELVSYLRDQRVEALAGFVTGVARMQAAYEKVRPLRAVGLEAYFQVHAIGAGVHALELRGRSAIEKRDRGTEDYYRSFVEADLVYNYLKGYMEKLIEACLSENSKEHTALASKVITVRTISLISLAAVGMVFAFFGVLFANYISRPIRRLAELSAHIAGGDLAVQEMPVRSGDEIGVLSAAFNTMSRSIRARVVDLEEKTELHQKLHEEALALERVQRSLQEARYLGLQSQINPHFLFNALNTIARTALFERAEGTSRLIQSLARLFRYHLRDPKKTVQLAEELEILEEYLSIQRYRYGDRLRYSIDCPQPVGDVPMPCFVLQPLVENAVKYGVEPVEKGGRVDVRVRAAGGRIHIEVRNTGNGLSPEKIRELSGAVRVSRESGTGIGVANVRERLALFYEGRETFEIMNGPDSGVTVRISFPASTSKEEPADVPAAGGG